MDLHLDLDDEEVEYLEEMGVHDILTQCLTKALKNVVLTKPPDVILSTAEAMGNFGEKHQTLVQGE